MNRDRPRTGDGIVAIAGPDNTAEFNDTMRKIKTGTRQHLDGSAQLVAFLLRGIRLQRSWRWSEPPTRGRLGAGADTQRRPLIVNMPYGIPGLTWSGTAGVPRIAAIRTGVSAAGERSALARRYQVVPGGLLERADCDPVVRHGSIRR